MNPVIMHINYCEQGQSIAEICQKAVQWGFDGVEFRDRPTGLTFPSRDAYLNAVAENARKSGLTQILFSCHADGVCSPDAAVRKKAVEGAVAFLQAAHAKTGAAVFNVFTDAVLNPNIPYGPDYSLHGSAIATEDQWRFAAEGYRRIGAAVQPLGVRLGFETHMSYLHDLPAAAMKLVRRIDSPVVGINMDYGNTVYFAGHPALEDTIRLYGSRLFDLHLKNSVGLSNGERIPTALGDGEINHREYLKLLKSIGYAGPVTLEAPRSGDREYYARQDIAYYKMLRDEIGWR